MQEQVLKILIVEDNPGDARLVMEDLREEGAAFEIHRAASLGEAVNALTQHPYDAGGGRPFDAILLDLNLPDSRGLDTFASLHARVPETPIVLLTGSDDDLLGIRAVQEGAQDYLVKGEAGGAAVARSIRFAVERNRSLQWHRKRTRQSMSGRVIGVIGVKGGVGTTTVALNIAAILGQDRTAIAAELRPDYGSFSAHFRRISGPNLSDLLAMPAEAMADADIEQRLVHSRSNLYLLLGPQTAELASELTAAHVSAIVSGLGRLADFAVLDLPGVWSAANAAAVRMCTSIVMVSERDEPSMMASAAMLERIRGLGVAKEALRLAVVNRSPSMEGLSKERIEALLGIRVAGVVPPSPDLCAAAQKAGTPVAVFRPRSAPASVLEAIARSAVESGAALPGAA